MSMRVLGTVLALVTLLFAGACGGGGGNLPDPTISFFNASPDSPDIDFFIDDDLQGGGRGFLQGTAFSSTDAKERDLSAVESGTTNEIDLLFVTLAKDKHYLVALLGLVNYGTEPLKRARLLMTEVDRRAPIGNKSRLYIHHGFNREVGFGTPNIDFQNPGDNPLFKASDIEFGRSRLLLIDSGVHTFHARRAGTEQVFAELANFSFGPGKIYAVYVVGVENGTGSLEPRIEVVEIPVK